MKSSPSYSSIHKAMKILKICMAAPQDSASVAEHLSISKQTATKYLSTMVACGVLLKDGQRYSECLSLRSDLARQVLAEIWNLLPASTVSLAKSIGRSDHKTKQIMYHLRDYGLVVYKGMKWRRS